LATWLLVALALNAGLVILAGAFLAGSLRRTNLILAACLVGMGTAVMALLLVSSIDSLPSLFRFNPIRVAKRIWELSDYSVVLQGLLAGVPVSLVGFGTILYALRFHRWRTHAAAGFMAVVLIVLTLTTVIASPSSVVPVAEVSPELTVPEGFTIQPYLPRGIFRPTSIAFDSNDRLYVANRDGLVYIVEDEDEDGIADDITLFSHKEAPALGVAVSPDDRTVYLAGGGQVWMLEDSDLDGGVDSRNLILDDLPSFTYDGHSNNGIEVGPDERLYITLGGTSDHGPEEHPTAGSILVANLDGSDLKVFARGLRNPYDLAFTPSGDLIVTDNGPDFQDQRLNWSPPDEINLVKEGGDYGYPNFFGYPPAWSDSTGPIAVFPSHSVPTGTIAYPGGQFPKEFGDTVFATLFGAFVNPQFKEQAKPKVVVIRLVESGPDLIRGEVEDFATGLTAPIDVAVDNEGRLYVADYGAHQVFQISYKGTQD